MFAPRFSILIAVVAVLALISAAEVDADKSARNARQLKSVKGLKSPKSPKSPKSMKCGKSDEKCRIRARRLEDDDRRPAHEVVESIGGDPKGAFYEKDSIITKDAIERLLEMSEEKYSLDDFDPNAPHHQQVFRAYSNLTPERLATYELSGKELVDAIGKDNAKAILDFVHESFGDATSVSQISLQHANMEEQRYIAPHMDAVDNAIVILGGSNASVVYLNADGESEVTTYPGKAVAHDASTVHKSAAFEGHRHALEIQTMQGGDCVLANFVK
mmetsp:Transcript_11396/g.26836  ORF Transcript_11396/g.26836 Transcript_11396/m.26836 type:complete len:273 (-) Transcript_11396:256-1074(-)